MHDAALDDDDDDDDDANETPSLPDSAGKPQKRERHRNEKQAFSTLRRRHEIGESVSTEIYQHASLQETWSETGNREQWSTLPDGQAFGSRQPGSINTLQPGRIKGEIRQEGRRHDTWFHEPLWQEQWREIPDRDEPGCQEVRRREEWSQDPGWFEARLGEDSSSQKTMLKDFERQQSWSQDHGWREIGVQPQQWRQDHDRRGPGYQQSLMQEPGVQPPWMQRPYCQQPGKQAIHERGRQRSGRQGSQTFRRQNSSVGVDRKPDVDFNGAEKESGVGKRGKAMKRGGAGSQKNAASRDDTAPQRNAATHSDPATRGKAARRNAAAMQRDEAVKRETTHENATAIHDSDAAETQRNVAATGVDARETCVNVVATQCDIPATYSDDAATNSDAAGTDSESDGEAVHDDSTATHSDVATLDVKLIDPNSIVEVRFGGMPRLNDQNQIDIRTIREYISDIADSSLDGFDVQIEFTDAKKEKCVVYITCPSARMADRLMSNINRHTEHTTVSAMLRSSIVSEIEKILKSVRAKSNRHLENHRQKIVEVEKELLTILDAKKNKRGVPFEEWERNRKELQVPLESKKCELQGQEREFSLYMRSLEEKLLALSGNENWKVIADRLRKEFGLELNRFESRLPMYARKSDIIRTVMENQVSVVLGETGSGKSTQMLQYLYQAGVHERGLVVCTQPRKVAATSLATRVAQEMGGSVGDLVGYQVGMQCRRGPLTHLLYVTDHVLLNDCLKDATFARYACIVIDEAHERSICTDLLLGFLKAALRQRPDLRVIITSATIDPQVFVSYFCGAALNNPVVLQVSGRMFPVEVLYETTKTEEDYVGAACRRAMSIHAEEPPGGDILAFLTSPLETEQACRKVRGRSDLIVLELHGRLQMDVQQRVFEPTPSGKRKIVFATNSAETSITIPGIKYVVDCGKVKEMTYDPKRNMSALILMWTTQSSAEQRKGRAGRTEAGRCYRLYTAIEHEAMRPESVPEILRVHVGQALLKLMALGVADPTLFDFVEAPSPDAIVAAMGVLRELGACEGEAGGITELGRKLAKLSIEPRLGKVALLGVERGVAYEAAIMAAVTSVDGNVFFRAGSDEQKRAADRLKTRFCDQWGDVVTLACVYREWEAVCRGMEGEVGVEGAGEGVAGVGGAREGEAGVEKAGEGVGKGQLEGKKEEVETEEIERAATRKNKEKLYDRMEKEVSERQELAVMNKNKKMLYGRVQKGVQEILGGSEGAQGESALGKAVEAEIHQGVSAREKEAKLGNQGKRGENRKGNNKQNNQGNKWKENSGKWKAEGGNKKDGGPRWTEGERRGKDWCQANSINAKSLRLARDALKDMLMTLEKEVGVKVERVYASDTVAANRTMARILFECYTANLAHFSGHRDMGYCVARHPSTALHVYPSSALNYVDACPRWVVYEQVLTTSRTFLINATPVQHDWVIEALETGTLFFDQDALEQRLLIEHPIRGVGGSCFKRLKQDRAREIKNQEQAILSDGPFDPLPQEEVRVKIDAFSEPGAVLVYAQLAVLPSAMMMVESFLCGIQETLRREIIELPVVKGNHSARFTLRAGADIQTILMPGETRQVKVTQRSPNVDVMPLLRSFGDIENDEVLPNESGVRLVTYRDPESAAAALRAKAYSTCLIEYSGVGKVERNEATPRRADFQVKVVAVRRPHRGYGYLTFQDIEDHFRIAAVLDCIKISKQFSQSKSVSALIRIQPDKKSDDQLYMREVPSWANQELITAALKDAYPGLPQFRISLPRIPVPTKVESDRTCERLKYLVAELLCQNYKFTKEEFNLSIIIPSEKDFAVKAFVSFHDPDRAQRAAENLTGTHFDGSLLEATFDLSTKFFVSMDNYSKIKEQLETEAAGLKAGGVATVVIGQTRNGGVPVHMSATTVEGLRMARARLDVFINGTQVNLDDIQLAALRQSKHALHSIAESTETRVRLDERRSALFIHGASERVLEARRRVEGHLAGEGREPMRELGLRGGRYPTVGLMKALVVKYGANLEGLHEELEAAYIELVLRKHTINIRCSDVAYQKLLNIVEATASALPGPRASAPQTPDCPICLTAVELSACYVTETCGHYYCADCARSLVHNACTNGVVPVTCAREGCGRALALQDLRGLGVLGDQLYEVALRAFMLANNKRYGYCVTPNCPMIYRKPPPDPATIRTVAHTIVVQGGRAGALVGGVVAPGMEPVAHVGVPEAHIGGPVAPGGGPVAPGTGPVTHGGGPAAPGGGPAAPGGGPAARDEASEERGVLQGVAGFFRRLFGVKTARTGDVPQDERAMGAATQGVGGTAQGVGDMEQGVGGVRHGMDRVAQGAGGVGHVDHMAHARPVEQGARAAVPAFRDEELRRGVRRVVTPDADGMVRRVVRRSQADQMKWDEKNFKFVCDACNTSICTKCEAGYHFGMTCDAHQRVKEIGDVPAWLESDRENRGRCPSCTAPIEKNGGCLHMHCTACSAHICWKCRKLLPTADATYLHLGHCTGIA